MTHLFALLAATLFFSERVQVSQEVPRGVAPRIDGKIGETEWADAARFEVTGGGRVSLKHDGTDLFLALEASGPMLLPNVCTTSGDTAKVLHSSAAFGQATYGLVMSGVSPRLSGFTWHTSGAANTAMPDSVRRAWDTLGWNASTARDGIASREYRVRLSSLDRSPRLAIVFAAINGPGAAWPSAVDDDCRAIGFAMGNAPGFARFDVRRWSALQLK